MGRLRLAPVEYKVCSTEGAWRPTEYEGLNCPKCHYPFDPTAMRKVTHDRLIVVGVDPPPYNPEKRFRCNNREAHYQRLTGTSPADKLNQAWDNLYDVGKRCCPLCDQAAPQRPTIVWVRTFYLQKLVEELERRDLPPSAEDDDEWERGLPESETREEEVKNNGEDDHE